jgi:hypothetical protein
LLGIFRLANSFFGRMTAKEETSPVVYVFGEESAFLARFEEGTKKYSLCLVVLFGRFG